MKTNITFIKSLTFFIALFCAVNFGFGQSIFDNPITGTNPASSDPYTIGQNVVSNITVSGIGRVGITGDDANDRYSSRNWSDTFNNTEYYYFTITPNAGYEINFVSFVYTGQRSPINGPTNFAFRSSLDLYTAPIGAPTDSGTTINLSSAAYQNISGAITFRFYAWGANNGTGTFSINDFTFNGVISALPPCGTETATWDGADWNWDGSTLQNTLPTIATTSNVIINGDYDTTVGGFQTSFSACSLIINSTFTLTVANGDYVEVENDVVADGGILVNSQANFIQNNDNATFTDNSGGLVVLSKDKTSQRWYSYTYWGSPVENENIEGALGPAPADRRFTFIAANFVDNDTEIGNTNTFTAGTPDGLDDNSNDWVNTPTGPMVPGVGYAATAGEFAPSFPITETFNFFGKFNNGEILVPLVSNSGGAYEDWNLVGNPYPCAINAIDFLTLNSSLIGVIYLWDQSTPPSSTTGGGQNSNFSADDYAMINGSGGIAATSNPLNTPNSFIPSGQGFFVDASSAGNLTFNNSLRAITNNNGQFFKKTKTKSKASNSSANKLWVNLTSDNGVFNQILVSYINGATNANDGDFYDAPRSLSSVNNTSLYSVIENDNSKFAIQAKATSSLNEDEIINLGFKTTITVPTLYKLSVAQLEGAFLTSNTLFLVDTLLNKVHDLSASDYTFTSAVGEFNSRFSIAFTNKALSVNDVLLNTNALKIVDLQDDFVQFNTSSNLTIKSVNIYDLLGRQLYQFKGENTSETYRLAHLNNSVYIAKVALSNGALVTKKAVKK